MGWLLKSVKPPVMVWQPQRNLAATVEWQQAPVVLCEHLNLQFIAADFLAPELPNMDMKAISGRSRARQQSSMDVAQMAPASSGEEHAFSRCPLLKAGLTKCHTSIAHALYWDHSVAWACCFRVG